MGLASLIDNRKGKSQVVGFSGTRTTLLAPEKGSRLRILGDKGLVWLVCALYCSSLAGYYFLLMAKMKPSECIPPVYSFAETQNAPLLVP